MVICILVIGIITYMESQSMSTNTINTKSRRNGSRRTWTVAEEQWLINALKDIVVAGWKADNGFKTGYLNALEQHLLARFPDSDLRGEPHIHSKIHVWRKNYGSLTTMLSRSGFGWNESSCTIDVPDEQVWAEYVKVSFAHNYLLHQVHFHICCT